MSSLLHDTVELSLEIDAYPAPTVIWTTGDNETVGKESIVTTTHLSGSRSELLFNQTSKSKPNTFSKFVAKTTSSLKKQKKNKFIQVNTKQGMGETRANAAHSVF